MPSLCKGLCCKKNATFNFAGNKQRLFCDQHKLQGMVSLHTGARRCKLCPKEASFNTPGEVARLFCKSHATSGMTDVGSRRCKTLGCDINVSKTKYDGLCLNCFRKANPLQKPACNIKIKENHMTGFIKGFVVGAVYDRPIISGTSMYRPDCFITLPTHSVVIECDENQHDDYDRVKEIERTAQMFIDGKARPMIVVRFNPDKYMCQGQKVKSCFAYDKSGAMFVSSPDKWHARLETLKEVILYSIATPPDIAESPFVVRLFYDK